MSDIKAILKNSAASLLIRVSTPFFSAVLYFYIARVLGPENAGLYESALALMYIFQALVAFGFPYFITREVAQDRTRAGQYLTNGSIISLGASLLMIAAMSITASLIMKNPATQTASWILSLSLLPYGLSMVYQSICRGFEKLEYIAIPTVIANVFKVGAGIVILILKADLLMLMWAITASHFILMILSYLFTIHLIRKTLNKIIKITKEFCRYIIKSSPLFILILFLGTVRLNISQLLLNSLINETEVGRYGAAFKLVNLVCLGITCYVMAVQPLIFRLFKASKEKFARISLRSINFFYIFILPMIAGISVLHRKIILLVYTSEYLPDSGYALIILSWLLLFIGFNQIFANVVVASGDQRINLHANIIGTVSLIALSFLLIPFYNLVGACIANVVSTLITLIFQYRFIHKNLFKIPLFKMALKPLLGSLLMGGVLFFLLKWNIFLLIPIGIVFYLLLMFAFRTFTGEELAIFKKIFSRNKKNQQD